MALEGCEGSASRPGRSLLPGKTWYSLYKKLDGPQGRSGQMRKISPPPGFDSRTVQPVAQSLYRLSYRPTFMVTLRVISGFHREVDGTPGYYTASTDVSGQHIGLVFMGTDR